MSDVFFGWLLGLPTWGLFIFGTVVLPVANRHHHLIHLDDRSRYAPTDDMQLDNIEPAARFARPKIVST